jgi:hypothetical protein
LNGYFQKGPNWQKNLSDKDPSTKTSDGSFVALMVARMELVRMMTKSIIDRKDNTNPLMIRIQKFLLRSKHRKGNQFLRDQINNYLIKITLNSVATENAEEASI